MAEKSVADGIELHKEDSYGRKVAESIPIAGGGIKTILNAKENFGEAEGVGGIVSAGKELVSDGASFVTEAGSDVVSFALDPVGTLVSNGLDMLLEVIQPLQDALHFVTGDGPALGDASGDFDKIGEGFVSLAEEFVQSGDETLKDWEGEAGDAARAALAKFSQGIEGIGSAANAVAETLKMWSMVMEVIEEVVKAIISDLISTLIYIWLPALASALITAGSSVAAATTATIAKVAAAFAKVTKRLGKLGKLLEKFMAFLGKWAAKMWDEEGKFRALAKGGRAAHPKLGNAVGGALANDFGVKGAVFRSEAGDILKGAPKKFGEKLGEKAIEEYTGVSQDDWKDFGEAGKVKKGTTIFKAGKKVYDEADKASHHHSTEETRDNLDMS
ncbi:hypothetical protein [Amycolatopsis benzoatilytica]|uniref:hypothetical protein n=1 Tax=Amycolatopsis benzoatilytica TaxID=346045 RepID=UPI00037992BB|nr:hypothetical protein [Amycolatopsis benzoatilytica]